MKLINYADLANDILEKSNDYIKSKKLIYSFFEIKEKSLTLEKVKLRLTIIDSIYSTNMSRRLFGINELANKILDLSELNDDILIAKINTFISNPSTKDEISKIFLEPFGIDKKGKPNGHATSLISKYFYFLVEFQFPIYDSLVKDNLPTINKKIYAVEDLILDKDRIKYFQDIIEFNKKSQINDFNKLDNMCWLFGKINRGSFSLILEKKQYLDLIKPIELTGKKSEQVDKAIKEHIAKEMPKDIFSNDEEQFIDWVNTSQNA